MKINRLENEQRDEIEENMIDIRLILNLNDLN